MKFWDPKRPADVDDFSWNWSEELEGSTIASATATELTTGKVTVGACTFTGPVSTVRLSGGVHQGIAKIQMRIVTSNGRTLTKEIGLQILN